MSEEQTTDEVTKDEKIEGIAEGDSSNSQSSIINQQSANSKLLNLLEAEPALAAKLLEALDTERFLITIHFQKKYSPADEHDLHHWQTNKGYPKQNVVSSLKCVASSFAAQEFPNNDLPDDKQWH